MAPPDDFEKLFPGTARERTDLAWTRTALSFAAVGGAMLKTDIAAGLTVVALSALVWGLHRIFPNAVASQARPRRHFVVAMTVVAVALVALVVGLLGGSR